jgi:hypothetical protein
MIRMLGVDKRLADYRHSGSRIGIDMASPARLKVTSDNRFVLFEETESGKSAKDKTTDSGCRVEADNDCAV